MYVRSTGWVAGLLVGPPGIWWEALDNAPQHLCLVSGRQGCQGCHERLPSRSFEWTQINREIAILGVEVAVGAVGEAFGESQVAAGDADVAIDDPDDLGFCQSSAHRSVSPGIHLLIVRS